MFHNWSNLFLFFTLIIKSYFHKKKKGLFAKMTLDLKKGQVCRVLLARATDLLSIPLLVVPNAGAGPGSETTN